MVYLITVVIVMYVFSLTASILNYKHRRSPIPEVVKSVYTRDKYEKWLSYSMAQFKLHMIEKGFSFIGLVTILLVDGFSKLEKAIVPLVTGEIYQTLIFLGIIAASMAILGLPFHYYETFVIEEYFGFNKTKRSTFVLDFIKQLLITAVIGGLILMGIQKFYILMDGNVLGFIGASWAASSVFMIAMFALNTKIFVKLFNKLKPLENEVLKADIDALSKKIGFDIKSIKVMDASKRSSKLNAFFSGFGKTKEVVLYDTLLEKMTNEEILAVLAHELGHAVHRDTLKMLIRTLILIGVYMTAFALLLVNSTLSFGYALIVLSILFEPINLFFGIGLNAISRRAEYTADAFSARHVGSMAMSSALRTLGAENFSNLTPHPLYVWLHYSHPPLYKRIDAIKVVGIGK